MIEELVIGLIVAVIVAAIVKFIGYIWSLGVKSPNVESPDMIECEFCRESIRFDTRKCPHCHSDFRKEYEPNAKGWHTVIPLFVVHQFNRKGRIIEKE